MAVGGLVTQVLTEFQGFSGNCAALNRSISMVCSGCARSFVADTCVQFNWDGYKEGARSTGLSWTENHWRRRATERNDQASDLASGWWPRTGTACRLGLWTASFYLHSKSILSFYKYLLSSYSRLRGIKQLTNDKNEKKKSLWRKTENVHEPVNIAGLWERQKELELCWAWCTCGGSYWGC